MTSFEGLGLQAELTPAEPMCDVMVIFGDGKRLLVSVTGTENSVTNKSAKIKTDLRGVSTRQRQRSDHPGWQRTSRASRWADREWLDPLDG